MAKITLPTISSGYATNTQLNEAFDAIEAEFQNKVLYRNNTSGEANQMENSFDMNSNRILNLPEPLNGNEAARLTDVNNALAGGAANLITATPYSHIAATTVQGFLQELTDEKTAVADLAATTGAALVGFKRPEVGAISQTVLAVLLLMARSPISYGAAANWDGTTGTDDTAAIQACINSFGGARGTVDLGDNRFRCDSARLDFKRCNIIGRYGIPNSGGGGAELYFGALGGLYTSVEDNSAPILKGFRTTSSSTRTANGQIGVDLTGVNYPAMEDVLVFGGEEGLRIKAGAVVESHYGNFRNVSTSKCFVGLMVKGGSTAQTHSFYGGRQWDCVTAYKNDDTGASDINFYGTAFESDQAIEHAATATAAQTKWFSCRNESNSFPAVQVGQFTEIGTYWSGNKRPATISVNPTGASGELDEFAAQLRNVAVNNAIDMASPNILPNALFEFDPSAARTAATVIPGWTAVGATHYNSGKADEGNYIRLERQAASGTVQWTSRKIPLKKGRYHFSCGWIKDGSTAGTVKIDFLQAGTSFGALGTYADVTFPVTYASSELVTYVDILQDIVDFQFRIQVDAQTNGRYFYIYNPIMGKGQRGIVSTPVNPRAAYVADGAAAPTTGTWSIGDTVFATAPTAGGNIGWVCTAAGTPGTWSQFGVIELSASATYDPPSLADGAGTTTTIAITGAAMGDFALASFSNDLQGITLTAYVSVAGTVAVRFQNETGGVLDLASGTLRVRVIKP